MVTRNVSFAVLIVCAGVSACGRAAPPPDVAAGSAIGVAVAPVAMRAIPERFETGGVVRARLTATLASRVTAPVDTVLVAPGARVRRGATLLTLECRELDANAARARASLAAAADSARAADADLRAAESSLTLARSTHERMRALFEKRSATPQEWDQSSAAVQEAEARSAASRSHAAAAGSAREAADAALRAAETALSYGTIAAPFDGVVSERLVDPGTLATAGTPLLVVEDSSALRLHVLVDEFRARTIAAGQPADARLDEGGAWIPTRVAEVGRVDAASHTFLVKLDLPPSAAARSGLFGRGRFTAGARNALVVPARSVVRRGELTFVFVAAADGTARLRPIVAGETAGDGVEVLAGLAEGDLAIVNPPVALADGMRVTRRP